MKILMINSVCGVGSTGRICTDIADMAVGAGHECKIAYGRGIVPDEYKKYAVRIGNDFDVKLHALKTRFFDAHGGGSAAATRRFIEWVKKYDPDVIHLHNIHGYYINLKILFSYLRTCKKRIIWTLHDCWAFTGHCAHFTAAACDGWKNGCGKCPQKREYPSCLVFGNSAKNYAQKKALFTGIPDMTLTAPSHWLAARAKESFLSCYEIKVIYNGIDFDIFKPTESDFRKEHNIAENEKMLLGAAGAWSEKKGFSDFIKLGKAIGKGYRIVMAGVSDRQAEAVPESIVCTPKTGSMTELAAIYSAADIFLNLSREEAMGLVIPEALACGTPVIVYDNTAMPEIISAECGAVVPTGDIGALCDEIKKMACNPPSAGACMARAAEFEKNRKFHEYILMYENK